MYQIELSPIQEQYTAFESLNSLIEAFQMSAILRNKVRNLLFDGYHDSLLEAASNFYPTQVSQTKFGWFYGRNNTSTDGLYRIFTGQSDGKKLGLIDMWNGEKNLSKWQRGETCRSLKHASAGDFQPPFFLTTNSHLLDYFASGQTEEAPASTMRIFMGDMCRTFDLELQKAINYNSLSGYRYRASPNLFNYSLAQNQCYCSRRK